MTLEDWFKINPNHKVTLSPSTSGGVRAVLHGGEGLDQRLVGEGTYANGADAIRHALESRELIRERTP